MWSLVSLPAYLALALSLCACAASPPPAPRAPGHRTPRPPLLEEARIQGLPPHASWAEWIDALRQARLPLQEHAGCLLLEAPRGIYRLGVPLAPALQPLPPAQERPPLDGGFAVLTRWGRLGDQRAGTLLATLTEHPPPRPWRARVLLLDERRIWLLQNADQPLLQPSLTEAREALLRQQQRAPAGLLVVTATPSTSLARLHEALLQLDPSRASLPPLALGFVLPEGTRTPDRSPAEAFACVDRGTAATSRSSDAPLEMLTDLSELTRRLRTRAAACLRRALREGVPSGRLVLRLTVAPDGGVEACTSIDEPRDPRLAECLVAAIRRWRLRAPPSEPLRVQLPLRLQGRAPLDLQPPRAACRPRTP